MRPLTSARPAMDQEGDLAGRAHREIKKGPPLPYDGYCLQATAAVTLVLTGLLLVTGCASHHPASGNREQRVVLERGRSSQNLPWQLAAAEHDGQVGLYLESPSGREYSGGVGWASGPAAALWADAAGPGGFDFYYGPAPTAAVAARLSAPGHASIFVRTRPLPSRAGLPGGRFFITQPPGPANVNWNVTLLDSAGHKVAFANC